MKDREIEESIQKLAGTYQKDIVSLKLCTVTSVDKESRTCECTPISGNADTTIPKVRLMAEANDGFLVLPKAGSTVMVALSSRGYAYVFMYSDIDEVNITIGEAGNYTSFDIKDGLQQFNDGSFGGMVKIVALTTKLNNLITQLTAQLGLIATGIAAGGGSYTPGTLSTFNKIDYENIKITHGE